MAYKVHKRKGYWSDKTARALCQLFAVTQVDTTLNWDDVTCKRCLAKRNDHI